MADYDAGEVTDRERQASENQTAISRQNARDVQNQLSRQLANYDFADAQNRALANTQLRQNSRKTSADRFEAQRDLQNSALGLLGSMGSAMNGSTTGNFMRMLESRNDKENNTYWAQHQVNQDSVENAYQDSVNQNRVARRDAMQSAEKSVKDIENDWRANMNNINPNLFPGANSPVAWDPDVSPWTVYEAWLPRAQQNNATISGYVMPDSQMGNAAVPRTQPQRNQVRGGKANTVGGDYFSQMMNRFNGR